MNEPLAHWANFYVMTGSSAAALTGLTFVVMSLMAGVERSRRSQQGVSAFTSPTVVHFCIALFVSAVLCAPWSGLALPALVLGAAALFGIVYIARSFVRMRGMTSYEPDLEDWTCFIIVPLVAYVMMAIGAIELPSHPVDAPFAFASTVVVLIFIGIRNAWDLVTYIAVADSAS